MSWRMCRSLPDIQEKKAFHVERKAWEKILRWQTQKMGINSYIETQDVASLLGNGHKWSWRKKFRSRLRSTMGFGLQTVVRIMWRQFSRRITTLLDFRRWLIPNSLLHWLRKVAVSPVRRLFNDIGRKWWMSDLNLWHIKALIRKEILY